MVDRPCAHFPAIMFEKNGAAGKLVFRAECIFCGMHGQACSTVEAAELDWEQLTATEPRCGRFAILLLPVAAIAAALIWRAVA